MSLIYKTRIFKVYDSNEELVHILEFHRKTSNLSIKKTLSKQVKKYGYRVEPFYPKEK